MKKIIPLRKLLDMNKSKILRTIQIFLAVSFLVACWWEFFGSWSGANGNIRFFDEGQVTITERNSGRINSGIRNPSHVNKPNKLRTEHALAILTMEDVIYVTSNYSGYWHEINQEENIGKKIKAKWRKSDYALRSLTIDGKEIIPSSKLAGPNYINLLILLCVMVIAYFFTQFKLKNSGKRKYGVREN